MFHVRKFCGVVRHRAGPFEFAPGIISQQIFNAKIFGFGCTLLGPLQEGYEMTVQLAIEVVVILLVIYAAVRFFRKRG